MAQSELERIGTDKRAELELKKDHTIDNQYELNHPDTIYQGAGDTKGKNPQNGFAKYDATPISTNKDTHDTAHITPNQTVFTSDGGGDYDIHGTIGVSGAFQGQAGREYLIGTSKLNPFTPQNEYGEGSVDITITKGQYIVS